MSRICLNISQDWEYIPCTLHADLFRAQDEGKKTLVLDLDETLVHSSFKPIMYPDFIIPVEIEGRIVDVYVLKRPLMDDFLTAVGKAFEVVVFTASLSKYADPLLDLLDPNGIIRYAAFHLQTLVLPWGEQFQFHVHRYKDILIA